MSGFFITFEGPDGTGKTTQIRLLSEALRNCGYEVVLTREPGGTAVSDKIRALLLDPAHTEMAAQTEILLYAASRAQHVQEVIRPAVAQGKIVLCDRFVDASIAYQAYGNQYPLDDVINVNAVATGGIRPDRTYLFMLPPEMARGRMIARQKATGELADRLELKPLEYHQRVYDGFAFLEQQNPERMVRVDASGTIEAIAEWILQDCQAFLSADRINI